MKYFFKIPFVLFFLVGWSLLLIQCRKDINSPNNSHFKDFPPDDVIEDTALVNLQVDSCVLIPIGQLLQKGNSVELLIDSSNYKYNTLDDGLGGYWAIIPNKIFEDQSTLKIRITRRNSSLQLFSFSNDTTTAYLKKSKMINWGDGGIKAKAFELYDEDKTTIENALIIQDFVKNHVEFDETFSNRFGGFSAMQTYYDQKGVCINFSRLFIALCRASNIPARSVSGVVYVTGEIGTDCFHHHQWCEFLDDNNQWRSLDLTYTSDVDISDITYIDFTYCAEETEIFRDYYDKFMHDMGRPFKTKNECTLIYCYLPTENKARFGFKLVHDESPDSLVFEKVVHIKKFKGLISINQL